MTISFRQIPKRNKFTDLIPLGFTETVELENLIITDFSQPPSLSIDWHAHEKPTLLFIFAGSVEEKFRRKTFQCSSASVLARPAEETHSHLYGSVGAKCLAVQVKSDYLYKSKIIAQTLDSVSFSQTSPLISSARKIQRELQIMDEASSLAIEGFFLEIVGKLTQTDKKISNPPIWLKNARDLANDCFRESLKLSEIAQEVGVHPVYLSEMFRQHFGVTLGEYIRNLRLDFAFRQIVETNRPLIEIAYDTGFYDQSHFNKRFRERFNVNPSKIRLTSKETK